MSADRGPASLLPAPLARLIGFALLGALAALQWVRMAEGVGAGRALTWVVAAVAAAGLVLAAQRLPERVRGWATVGATFAGLALAVLLSGLELDLLRPRRWSELGEGLVRGVEALGGVRLPYEGRDPWPREALELSGALLCTLSALVAIWPRGRAVGYPFLALAALLTLVATPIVALGGTQSLVLGAVLAALSAMFLWLERLPVRPGIGVAVLAGLALSAALPLGAAADREDPWFDYRAWAEGLGPLDPVAYDWDHEYGPIQLPRDGVELFRVRADEAFYWKAANLFDFDGVRWEEGRRLDMDFEDPTDDLPVQGIDREDWTETFDVSLRRLRSETIVGAGTILDVPASSRPVEQDELRPDRFEPARGAAFGRGDSYTVEAHVPRPDPQELGAATSGFDPRRAQALNLRLDFRDDALYDDPTAPTLPNGFDPQGTPVDSALFSFPPFASDARPVAEYRLVDVPGDGVRALRRTHYWRTYQLSRRLKRGAQTPYEFVVRVNNFLRSEPFIYTETPPGTSEVAPLDEFLNDTRAGYCQHYAGAMALLLRMGGVPARVVTGFSPGGYRKKREEWIVRDTDAHSWVEAWFDGLGWITFDPTPPSTPARSQIAAIDPPETDEPEEEATTAPDDPLARRPEGIAPEGVAAAAGGGDDGGPPWPLIGGGAAALAALGAFLVVRRRRRRTDRPPAGDLALAELERALRRAGRPARPGMTLIALERRLGASTEGAAYLRKLRAARYATTAPPLTNADRSAFRRDLAGGLGLRGRIRALWALPPRLRG